MTKPTQNIMHKLFLFFIFLIVLNSCKHKFDEDFKNRITELESENKKLKDSLENAVHKRLINSIMVGFPDKVEYSPNDSGKVYFYFKNIETIPEYNVYTITEDFKPDKLILENQNMNQFAIPFNTNELKNNEVEVIAVFKDIKLEILMSQQLKIQN